MKTKLLILTALIALPGCGAEDDNKSEAVEQTIINCEVNLNHCIENAENGGESQTIECQQEFNICTSTVEDNDQDNDTQTETVTDNSTQNNGFNS